MAKSRIFDERFNEMCTLSNYKCRFGGKILWSMCITSPVVSFVVYNPGVNGGQAHQATGQYTYNRYNRLIVLTGQCVLVNTTHSLQLFESYTAIF